LLPNTGGSATELSVTGSATGAAVMVAACAPGPKISGQYCSHDRMFPRLPSFRRPGDDTACLSSKRCGGC